jgi:hypothetical protein
MSVTITDVYVVSDPAAEFPCGFRGCTTRVTVAVACGECRRPYARCESHGGLAGARRSLRSHHGLWGHAGTADLQRGPAPFAPAVRNGEVC